MTIEVTIGSVSEKPPTRTPRTSSVTHAVVDEQSNAVVKMLLNMTVLSPLGGGKAGEFGQRVVSGKDYL